jgi:hypothetical protein
VHIDRNSLVMLGVSKFLWLGTCFRDFEGSSRNLITGQLTLDTGPFSVRFDLWGIEAAKVSGWDASVGFIWCALGMSGGVEQVREICFPWH